jgi:hypothetical protein
VLGRRTGWLRCGTTLRVCSITVLCMCIARAGAEDSLAEVWDDPACVLSHSVVFVYRTSCVPVLLLEVLDDFARGLGCVWVVQTVNSSLLLADVRYTVVRAG